MRKTVLLLGMALIASSAMMGQVVNRNMAAAITSENAETCFRFCCDKNKGRQTECGKLCTDTIRKKRKAYEVSMQL